MPEHGYVSRGGLKLRHALDEFHIDPAGLTCADLGASTGGFTDCLLQAGAARVFAVDTAYGEFAWKLRNDSRVTVLERTNALHAPPPELVDLVVLDLGWTPQRLAIPAAMRWLKPAGRVITLIKPHYEHKDRGGRLPHGGVLAMEDAARIAELTASEMPTLGVRVIAMTTSPVVGGTRKKGNAEWLALIQRA